MIKDGSEKALKKGKRLRRKSGELLREGKW